MAGIEDDAQHGGGDALGGALLLTEDAAGDGGRVERGDGHRVAEARVAAVREGVEVAALCTRAGAVATMAEPGREGGDEIRDRVGYDGAFLRRALRCSVAEVAMRRT